MVFQQWKCQWWHNESYVSWPVECQMIHVWKLSNWLNRGGTHSENCLLLVCSVGEHLSLMSWSMILRYSSAMLEITSLTWQTLEFLMILHKHSVPWESGLSNAKTMRHLDPATGIADEEINEGAEEFEVKLDLWEVRVLVEQIEDGAGGLP